MPTETLETLCVARGLTLVQLAERSGVPLLTVLQLEAGTRRPHPATLLRLGAALGLPPAAVAAVLPGSRRRNLKE